MLEHLQEVFTRVSGKPTINRKLRRAIEATMSELEQLKNKS